FIAIDNVLRTEHYYNGDIDTAQLAWLTADLQANRKPVCFFSHIPLMAACAFNFHKHVTPGFWKIPDCWVHRNAMPLIALLREHNVKLCLSGHLHMVDRIDFLGMTFICNGSVCGRWWNGPYQEFAEGYGLIDLYDDGSFEHQYVAYADVAAGA